MVVASPPLPDNTTLAANLREFADVLTQQQADGFRISAYRRAADVAAGLSQSVSEILKASGREGLTALPGIGLGICVRFGGDGHDGTLVATGTNSWGARTRKAVSNHSGNRQGIGDPPP